MIEDETHPRECPVRAKRPEAPSAFMNIRTRRGSMGCMQMARETERHTVRRVSFTHMADLTYSSARQDHRPESRMREICTSGSEGGGALTGSPYPYSERPLVGCYGGVRCDVSGRCSL